MLDASSGRSRSARPPVYRHSLVNALKPLLESLERGRGWSAFTFALAMILMGWEPDSTITRRFDAVRSILDLGLPLRWRRRRRTCRGLAKAMLRQGDALIDRLAETFRDRVGQLAPHGQRWGEFVPIAVDGSKIDAPKTIGNEQLGFAGKDKCLPQMNLLMMLHLGIGQLWGWQIDGVRTSERALLRRAIPDLPENTLLVADAGFFGYQMLRCLMEHKVDFLIRVKGNARLIRRLDADRRKRDARVWHWPNAHRGRAPLELRLIRCRKDVFLLTSVLDRRRLSDGRASKLYARRWEIETSFRSFKQELSSRKVCSRTPELAKLELAWRLLSFWALSLLAIGQQVRGSGTLERLSVAAALRNVRHAARQCRGSRSETQQLNRGLRLAVRDKYRRKCSRMSYQRSYKKQHDPGTPPEIRDATDAEVQKAKALLPQKVDV